MSSTNVARCANKKRRPNTTGNTPGMFSRVLSKLVTVILSGVSMLTRNAKSKYSNMNNTTSLVLCNAAIAPMAFACSEHSCTMRANFTYPDVSISLPCRLSIARSRARLAGLKASRNKRMAATIDLFAFEPLNVTFPSSKYFKASLSVTPSNTTNAFDENAGKESEHTRSFVLFVSEHSMLHNACCGLVKLTRTCTVAVKQHCHSAATILVSFAMRASYIAK